MARNKIIDWLMHTDRFDNIDEQIEQIVERSSANTEQLRTINNQLESVHARLNVISANVHKLIPHIAPPYSTLTYKPGKWHAICANCHGKFDYPTEHVCQGMRVDVDGDKVNRFNV